MRRSAIFKIMVSNGFLGIYDRSYGMYRFNNSFNSSHSITITEELMSDGDNIYEKEIINRIIIHIIDLCGYYNKSDVKFYRI